MDRARFYATVRSNGLFSSLSQDQVERIEPVLDGIQNRGIPLRQSAYILATAFHESDRFKTLEEYASGKAYEGRKTLGNTVAGDGEKFKGRGYVQVTGRRNYADWSRRLGIDMLKEPKLAAVPENAVAILIDGMRLGTFTGKKLETYIAGDKVDYVEARRIVNGKDKAAMIAGYAEKFAQALREAAYVGQAPAKPLDIPVNLPVPDAPPPPREPAPQVSSAEPLLIRILKAILSIFTRKS